MEPGGYAKPQSAGAHGTLHWESPVAFKEQRHTRRFNGPTILDILEFKNYNKSIVRQGSNHRFAQNDHKPKSI